MLPSGPITCPRCGQGLLIATGGCTRKLVCYVCRYEAPLEKPVVPVADDWATVEL